MGSSRNSNHGSKYANGQKIREFRCQLGLTQLELATKIDCSERLVRKLEKNESVSLKTLSLLCSFLKAQNVEVSLNDLVLNTIDPAEVGKRWFSERLSARFTQHQNEADKRWFSRDLILSNSTVSKLEILQQFAESAEISIGKVVHHGQDAAINFHVKLNENPAQAPSGSIWLSVENQNIMKLHVMLDSGFEWGEI